MEGTRTDQRIWAWSRIEKRLAFAVCDEILWTDTATFALLLPGARCSATVSALEDGETRSVYRDDFARLQISHPGVKDVLLRLLAEQLRRASDRIVEAHYVDAETRVRRRLSELTGTYGSDVVPLTQEDLAAMAGTSRATVNRVLREEEKRGTVALKRGRTTVLDLAALDRRCRWAS
jgi:CRP-like cAMP-binding protein